MISANDGSLSYNSIYITPRLPSDRFKLMLTLQYITSDKTPTNIYDS